jgi:hypothetical protein
MRAQKSGIFMVISWFDTSEVRKFAADICVEYVKLRKSVQIRKDSTGKKNERFAKLKAKAEAFYRSTSLNVFKRARLIDELRTGFGAAGVPADEASDFISSILVAPLNK